MWAKQRLRGLAGLVVDRPRPSLFTQKAYAPMSRIVNLKADLERSLVRVFHLDFVEDVKW
jgi:hypothetical protein